jgi:cell division septation protein DedD
MRNKETGEFELVVGDKQLLSGFFIGVLLLAVVFAMGYVLGRGTPKSASVAPETAASSNAATATRPEAASAAAQPSPVAADVPAASVPVMNPDVTHPETTPTATTPPAEQPPQPSTVPARDASAPAPKAPPASPPADPANASYWQVLAGSQSSADALSQTLKGQGFSVITRPGPNNLTLVWVGPYGDKAALSRAKKKLEDAGISNLYKKP